MVIQTTKTYSVGEFEEFLGRGAEPERYYELIRGVIVEKAMPSDVHAFVAGLIIFSLGNYARQHGLGLPGPERRFVFPGDTQESRQPDVSQILDPAVPFVDRGPMRVIPDLVAEVMSPDDSIEGLREKAQFYTEKGVRLTWLISPRQRIVEVYRPGQAIEMLSIKDTLEGYEVLLGFSVAVAEFFPENRGG